MAAELEKLATGKLRLKGDMMFAQQFQSLFNRPS